jgi:hypothetical protein
MDAISKIMMTVAENPNRVREADLGRLAKMVRKVESAECANCGKKAVSILDGGDFKQCSRCKGVKYCSKECQAGDWKAHKRVCKQ